MELEMWLTSREISLRALLLVATSTDVKLRPRRRYKRFFSLAPPAVLVTGWFACFSKHFQEGGRCRPSEHGGRMRAKTRMGWSGGSRHGRTWKKNTGGRRDSERGGGDATSVAARNRRSLYLTVAVPWSIGRNGPEFACRNAIYILQHPQYTRMSFSCPHPLPVNFFLYISSIESRFLRWRYEAWRARRTARQPDGMETLFQTETPLDTFAQNAAEFDHRFLLGTRLFLS